MDGAIRGDGGSRNFDYNVAVEAHLVKKGRPSPGENFVVEDFRNVNPFVVDRENSGNV